MERCWQQANRVIDKDIRLLILGQTGVGKNEFVKALHKNSQRKNGPLVAVNCGALAKELVEAELFVMSLAPLPEPVIKDTKGKCV